MQAEVVRRYVCAHCGRMAAFSKNGTEPMRGLGTWRCPQTGNKEGVRVLRSKSEQEALVERQDVV